MGQKEVIQVLEKKKEWLTAAQIAKVLNIKNATLVRRALKKCYDYQEVLRKEIRSEINHVVYSYKSK